jgi:hypothetical protein
LYSETSGFRSYDKAHLHKTLDRLEFETTDRLLINELAAQSNVCVKWLITNKKTTFNAYPTFSFSKIEQLDDVDAIIVPNKIEWESQTYFYKPKGQAKVIFLAAIISNLYDYEVKYRLIERLHGLQKRGIQTLVLQMPQSEKVKNPSEFEQILNKNNWINGNAIMNDWDKLYPISGVGSKYTHEIFSNGSLNGGGQIPYKDYVVCANTQSKYVNIINHIKPAVGIPNNAIRTIHIIGDSTAQGIGVMDEDTIASYLQRKINETQMGVFSR